MSILEFTHSNTNPAQPPTHDAQDDAHNHIGNSFCMIIITRKQLEDHQKPNQKEINFIKRKRDRPNIKIRLHGHNVAHQKTNWDKYKNDAGYFAPCKMLGGDVLEKKDTKYYGKLDKKKGA